MEKSSCGLFFEKNSQFVIEYGPTQAEIQKNRYDVVKAGPVDFDDFNPARFTLAASYLTWQMSITGEYEGCSISFSVPSPQDIDTMMGTGSYDPMTNQIFGEFGYTRKAGVDVSFEAARQQKMSFVFRIVLGHVGTAAQKLAAMPKTIAAPATAAEFLKIPQLMIEYGQPGKTQKFQLHTLRALAPDERVPGRFSVALGFSSWNCEFTGCFAMVHFTASASYGGKMDILMGQTFYDQKAGGLVGEFRYLRYHDQNLKPGEAEAKNMVFPCKITAGTVAATAPPTFVYRYPAPMGVFFAKVPAMHIKYTWLKTPYVFDFVKTKAPAFDKADARKFTLEGGFNIWNVTITGNDADFTIKLTHEHDVMEGKGQFVAAANELRGSVKFTAIKGAPAPVHPDVPSEVPFEIEAGAVHSGPLGFAGHP